MRKLVTIPLLGRLLWQHPPWASSNLHVSGSNSLISTYSPLAILWMSLGGTVAKPGNVPMIWEADGNALGVVDAPSPDGEVTTGTTGLWLPLGASVNTGRIHRHAPGSSGQGEGGSYQLTTTIWTLKWFEIPVSAT